MIKVAITGNIASGKSQAEKLLEKDFPVFDTDKIAHKILDEMESFFDYDVLTDGKIDRKKLGDLVFKNPKIKEELEKIVHPKVRQEILEILKKDYTIVFISVPLLFEAGFDNLFDKIIFVDADENIRLERLMKRNNLTKAEALLRIKAQQDSALKIAKSDYVIYNNSTLENLKFELEKVLNSLI